MKIEYFFPVFKEDNIKEFLTGFKKSNFFKNNPKYKMLFVCNKEDKNNIDYLSKEAIKNPDCTVLILDKNYTYNDAFYVALPHFKCDVLLLGDTKIARNDLIFEKCMQKYEKDISVVHVSKKQKGFKGFIVNTLQKVYNAFIKLFTGRKDRCNIISLGLINKHVLDLLKVLPNKCCFLKNTKGLMGFETRTIYIDPKTKIYKNNFKKPTGALKAFYGFLGAAGVLLTAQILLNIFLKANLTIYNIINILTLFVCFTTSVLIFPKHIYDIRNRESKNIDFKIEQINKD